MEDIFVGTTLAFYTVFSSLQLFPLCRTSSLVRTESGPVLSLKSPSAESVRRSTVEIQQRSPNSCRGTQLVVMSIKTKGARPVTSSGSECLRTQLTFATPKPAGAFPRLQSLFPTPPVHSRPQMPSLPAQTNSLSKKDCLIDCHHPGLPEKAPPPGHCRQP